MEALKLVEPSAAYRDEILAYRREFLAQSGALHGCGALERYERAEDWLAHVAAMCSRDTCPPELVPSTSLLCIRLSDGRLVGMIDIRHELNDHLRRFGGHIGYSVRPSERRKGYAGAQLRLGLAAAGGLGLDRVLITCDRENEGSRRTILACGGVLEDEIMDENGTWIQRYWVEVCHE